MYKIKIVPFNLRIVTIAELTAGNVKANVGACYDEYDVFYIKFQYRTEFNNYTIMFYEYNLFS